MIHNLTVKDIEKIQVKFANIPPPSKGGFIYRYSELLNFRSYNISEPAVDFGDNPDLTIPISTYQSLYTRICESHEGGDEAAVRAVVEDLAELGVNYSATIEEVPLRFLGVKVRVSSGTNVTIYAKQRKTGEEKVMANMALQEIKQEIANLNRDLLNRVAEFENKTGCVVSDIDVDRISEPRWDDEGNMSSVISNIKAEVRIF